MRVITLAGSPRFPSRSSALLEYAREKLHGQDVEVFHWNLHNFAPEDLIYARFDSPALNTFTEQLQDADGLIVATPVYKAAYSGALKTLLDLLPERALEGKVVLPLATGGSVAHLLAVDYALKPVLSALKAQRSCTVCLLMIHRSLIISINLSLRPTCSSVWTVHSIPSGWRCIVTMSNFLN